MGERNGGSSVCFVAQVRKASAEHCVEPKSGLLRSKHFPKPNKVVYLGDFAQALLTCLDLPDTPVFDQLPGFNEQRWGFRTSSGSLNVAVSSEPYWFFGLFNSSYLNVLTCEGEYQDISRLLFDIDAVLSQSPWEITHGRAYDKFARQRNLPLSKDNENNWKAHLRSAHEHFQETIDHYDDLVTKSLSSKPEAMETAQQDLSMAKKALLDRNAPGIERALSRLEALMIQFNIVTPYQEGEEHVIESSDGISDIPFVDYTDENMDIEEE